MLLPPYFPHHDVLYSEVPSLLKLLPSDILSWKWENSLIYCPTHLLLTPLPSSPYPSSLSISRALALCSKWNHFLWLSPWYVLKSGGPRHLLFCFGLTLLVASIPYRNADRNAGTYGCMRLFLLAVRSLQHEKSIPEQSQSGTEIGFFPSLIVRTDLIF